MATVTRRPIHDIMYSEGEYDVLFLQPTLYQRWLAHEQNEVFLAHQQVVEGHAALMNDLGTEPNHGILQLAAILMQDGLDVDVLDFHVLDIVFRRDSRLVDEADIRDVLARKRARVFGISSKIISANRAFQLARIVKELHPDSTVLIGGVHPTFQAPEILEDCPEIDVVARDESDHTIRELWRWDQGQVDLADVGGITYRGPDGRPVSTEKSLEQIDLDSLPYPAYELVAREVDPLVPRILTAPGLHPALRVLRQRRPVRLPVQLPRGPTGGRPDAVHTAPVRGRVHLPGRPHVHGPQGDRPGHLPGDRPPPARRPVEHADHHRPHRPVRRRADGSRRVRAGRFRSRVRRATPRRRGQQARGDQPHQGPVQGHEGRRDQRPDLLGLRAPRRDVRLRHEHRQPHARAGPRGTRRCLPHHRRHPLPGHAAVLEPRRVRHPHRGRQLRQLHIQRRLPRHRPTGHRIRRAHPRPHLHVLAARPCRGHRRVQGPLRRQDPPRALHPLLIPSSIYTAEAVTPNHAASATADRRTPVGAGTRGRDPKPATRTMVELKRSRRILQYGQDTEPQAS